MFHPAALARRLRISRIRRSSVRLTFTCGNGPSSPRNISRKSCARTPRLAPITRWPMGLDPRSRRNRARRRGGQLLTRARSSSCGSACPNLCAPGASVPDAHSIRGDPQMPQPNIGSLFLLPVTNPIESTFATLRHW